MRSKAQLLNDYKLKKFKTEVNNERNADTLFNLVLKYILPLEPDVFIFTVSEDYMNINVEKGAWKISLKLVYTPDTPEQEAFLGMSINKNGGTSGQAGWSRAKVQLKSIERELK